MPQPALCFIIARPRSGSTVLSALLDKRIGIVSPPESSFPQVLGVVSEKERCDHRWMAALYIGATFPPTPLNLDDAEACMEGSNEEVLIKLGMAVAKKLGRESEDIKGIVWKTPRTVGMHAGPLSTSGKFVILRRNSHNVFESQFRVGFGENNRNPYRFAIFSESYEHAFSKVPDERKIDVHYDDLPGVITNIMEFIGVPDEGERVGGTSSLEEASKACDWLSEVTKEFNNTDPEKRARLDARVVRKLELALAFTKPFRPFMGFLRSYFDNRTMQNVRKIAAEKLSD
ncbi:MAG: sulfotransferase [Akkermansiaceae bacterium]|nr:sulfotransferase [Akkermansiaceae bacterium]